MVRSIERLRIPQMYHARLLTLKTSEALWDCPGLDDDTILRLDHYMFETPLENVMQQPDYILNDVEDLVRYKEGELIAFLLKLSPEQEKYVRWPLNATGPTLVKGGPGTGKSTIALYRIRSLLEQLLHAGKNAPRILFTTYTNALIRSSEQLLQQLLGSDARHVQVQTADKLAYEVLRGHGSVRDIIEPDVLTRLTRQAIDEVILEGNRLQQQAQKQMLERIGIDYLLQEINSVIVARQITTLEKYLAAPRTGRKLRLNAAQRRLVWRIYACWRDLLLASGKETWQQRRASAAALVGQSPLSCSYDAVVIDEAQDLDPAVLRMLIQLCKAPNRLFVTADANQSIYGSGFTWSDVHESLRFQGRTGILRANYRSTHEIGEAAQSYLTSGALESEAGEECYVNSGPLPDIRSVSHREDEMRLLVDFFKKACQSLRLALESCAVLCPNKGAGNAIARMLTEQGMEATYMEGQKLDLAHAGIKVLTLHSSKGLEFPIVSLAGFVSSNYPIIPQAALEDERAELLACAQRTLYVGMTRAMRALLVVVPAQSDSPLWQGFDPACWNWGRKA